MKALMIAMLAIAGNASAASAPVAGSVTLGVAVAEVTAVAHGWSVKKSILGKTVFNDVGAKVGAVEDLIIDPEKSISYVIVGAGGFVGIARHDVAIPVAQIHEEAGRLVLAGATKESVKALPEFEYAKADTADGNTDNVRGKVVAEAEREIAKARETTADLEKRAAAAKGEAKAKLDQHVATLHQDLKAAEDKLAEVKKAGEKKWKQLEAELNKAMDRVRQSLAKAA